MKILSKFFAVLFLFVVAFAAQATTFTVRNTADNGINSLRFWMQFVSTGDTIRFSPNINGQTINLSSSIIIPASVAIIGNGRQHTLIQLTGNTGSALSVTGWLNVNISDLTIGGGTNAISIDTNGEISLWGCVFNSCVYIYAPRLLYIYKCDFRGLTSGLNVIEIGLRQPWLGANSYFIAESVFSNNNNSTSNTSYSAALGVSGTSIFPINVRLTSCKFVNNLLDYSPLSYTLNSTDSMKITGCNFDNNAVRMNIPHGQPIPANGSAIMARGGTSIVMNSFFRGNRENINTVSNINLIAIRGGGSLNLSQNQITGNNGAGIRLSNDFIYNNTSTGRSIICKQNTIAHNNNAAIVANNLQVGNSYMETTFNIVNTPTSLGGNFFAFPPSWATSFDILVSPTNSLLPCFIAPITSIPSIGGNYRLATNSFLLDGGDDANAPLDIFDYDSDGNIIERVPFDIVGNPRKIGRRVDIGAYERPLNGGGLRAENSEETAELLANTTKTIVYPNPANEVLNINYELTAGAERAEIAIFNTIGQVVYQNTVNAENKALKVDVRNFEKGLYVIKIVDNQGNTQNYKVVVQ